ncbi:MAG TPA: hypothetical protein VLI54_06165 [Bacillota bacterium]|nr:hypothetical protein [Bacillota bacterium]
MAIVSPEGDPYCDLGSRPGTVWLDIPEGRELHQAVADLYNGMHPYATRVQTQTPDGQYITVERGLHSSRSEFPSAGTPMGPQGPNGLDPYGYVIIQHKPNDQTSFNMPLQQTSRGMPIVSGIRQRTVGRVVGEQALSEQRVADMAGSLLAAIRQVIPNTSELAPMLTWSEVQGSEALAIQDTAAALMEHAGVGPADLQDQLMVVRPRRLAPMPWALRHVIVGRVPEPEAHISDTELNTLVTWNTGHLALSYAVYDGGQPLTTRFRHSFGDGRQRFLAPETRLKAQEACSRQLDLSNVDIELQPFGS